MAGGIASADVSADRSNPRGWLRDDVVVAGMVAALGSLLVVVSGVRGADYPAQELRALLWDRAGFAIWNNYWYGGHPTTSYSVIAPPIMAFGRPVMVGLIASVVAAACFADVLRSSLPSLATRWGSIVFAVATVVNVTVGRVSFALGLAFAVAAVWAWRRGLLAVAVLFGVLTPLASPVAATFLGLGAAAVCLDALWPGERGTGWAARVRRAMPSIAVGAATTVPLLAMAVLVGSGGGVFPFRGGHLVISLIVMGVAGFTIDHRVVRIGLVAAVAASLVIFAVPSPLGGNFIRLAQFIVVPLAAAGALRETGRWRVPVLVLAWVGVGWTVQHGVVAARDWAGDPSTERAYHQPLIDEVVQRNGDGLPIGRLEIPFTNNHWESYFVAPDVPLARGWERQTDLDRNDALYDADLSIDEYHAWLLTNGVRWVALPDAPLDQGGAPEGELLAGVGDIEWLTPIWRNDDWQLFEVVGYQPIVDAPAVFVSQAPDEFVVSTDAAATVTVRFVATIDASISGGACLAATDDGWMRVTLPAAGTYTVRVEPSALFGSATSACNTD